MLNSLNDKEGNMSELHSEDFKIVRIEIVDERHKWG